MARSTRARRAASAAVRKTNKGTLLLAVLCLVLGAAVGAVVAWVMTKDDSFTLNGEKQVTVALGGTYIEEGAEAISFGRDISDKIVIAGDAVDTDTEGVYQVVYTVEDVRWGEYRLVRTVIVEGAESVAATGQGEAEGGNF